MPGTTVTAYMYRMFYLVSFRKVVPEKAMAPHSGTHAWRIPWMEETGRLQSMGSLRVRHDWATSLSCIGKGNGNPPQCSCLENPRDRGAWWAAVYGVAQSWTQLKWLSNSSSRKVVLVVKKKKKESAFYNEAIGTWPSWN